MKAERCPVCHMKIRRSNAMNRRYWLVLHLLADNLRPEGKTFNADTWHCYMKQRFLGCDDITLPNKKVVSIPRSSADLDKDEFAEYALKVEQFGMKHDIYLEEMTT